MAAQEYPADEFAPPDGALLIGLLDGLPVTGGGAFRRFDDATAELKRIWTDSRYRQRGYAKALLAELERRDRRARISPGVPHDRRPPARGRGAVPRRPDTRGWPSRCLPRARSIRSRSRRHCDDRAPAPRASRSTATAGIRRRGATHPDGEPVTSGRYWSGLAATAERGLLDFVTVRRRAHPAAATPRPSIEPALAGGTARRRAGRRPGWRR